MNIESSKVTMTWEEITVALQSKPPASSVEQILKNIDDVFIEEANKRQLTAHKGKE